MLYRFSLLNNEVLEKSEELKEKWFIYDDFINELKFHFNNVYVEWWNRDMIALFYPNDFDELYKFMLILIEK